MSKPSLLFTIILLVSVSNTFAEGLKIKPGKWEFISTTTMVGMGAPRQHTNTECLKDAELRPEKMMKDMNQGCQLSDTKTSSSNASWKVTCDNQGGQMVGEGQVASKGDTLTGGMDMSMSVNGQSMNMKIDWVGKHVGDCG